MLNLKIQSIVKLVKRGNQAKETALNSQHKSIIHFALTFKNIGGEANEPISKPTYTTDPRIPSDALSNFKSLLIVTVQAGIHP